MGSAKEGKYIYCIIRGNGNQSFGQMGIGERGDEVCEVSFNDIAAVVSNSLIIKYPVSRQNLLAHEKTIERVMKEHTVLPVCFGTIAEDENKVRKILEKECGRFKNLLDKFDGKKELGLKAIFKEDVVYKEILDKYENIRALKDKLSDLPPEKTYYHRMEIGKMVETALQKEKGFYKEEFLNVLSPIAVEVKVNDNYGERMISNAAFLVEEERESEFDGQVQELDRKYGEKINFKYTGTLPPFNFINVVIATKEY